MPAARYLDDPAQRRSRLFRRLTSLALTLGIELLLVLALLTLSPRLPPEIEVPVRPNTFSLSPAPKPASPEKPKPRAQPKQNTAAPTPPPPPRPTPPPPVPDQPKLIEMTSEDFAATDIAKIPSTRDGQPDSASTGKDSVAAYGPGEGPGGQRLFYAEWVREPSRAELGGYLPANFRTGTADIACRTIERNEVDNCRSLGESPLGSGLAKAMRLAAWQFRIRPPRVNGKPIIGAWVRIHFDFTEKAVER